MAILSTIERLPELAGKVSLILLILVDIIKGVHSHPLYSSIHYGTAYK